MPVGRASVWMSPQEMAIMARAFDAMRSHPELFAGIETPPGIELPRLSYQWRRKSDRLYLGLGAREHREVSCKYCGLPLFFSVWGGIPHHAAPADEEACKTRRRAGRVDDGECSPDVSAAAQTDDGAA